MENIGIHRDDRSKKTNEISYQIRLSTHMKLNTLRVSVVSSHRDYFNF